MGRITIDQSHQIMAILATNTNWEGVDFDGLQDTIVRNPKGAGVAFVAWLKSGATIETVVKAPLPKKKPIKSVLAFREEVLVGPLTKRFVRRKFFITRPGLYVWNDMERVLSATQDAEPSEEVTALNSFDITEKSFDRTIKLELPKRHESELWQIAELIDRQKNGEDGVLLTNGGANIFYVAGFAVNVYWRSVECRWRILDWEQGGFQWRAGDRVFSSN